jgi:hypothetical protein
MKRIYALGAAALLALGLYATASAVASASAPVVAAVGDVCPEDGKVEVDGNHTSIVVTAPEGMVITGYCVKAGSGQQEEGPEYVNFDPPVTEVTITHSSGKDISHYTVFYAPAPTPTPTPTPTEPTPTPTEPTPTPTEPTPTPTEPTPTPTEPTPTPTEPTPTPTEPTPTPTEPTEKPTPVTPPTTPTPPSGLASTGPAETIGYSMLALSMIGGGVAFIVLARRRLA